MNTVAIVQARMGSTRLPGKVLMDLGGRSMLAFMLARLARSRALDRVVVATTLEVDDDPIERLCDILAIGIFRGSEEDVLGRYLGAADFFQADVVVRLTADCPLICPEVTDRIISAYHAASPAADYVSNCIRRTYPRGLDTEVVSRSALESAAREAVEPADREHVTRFIHRRPERFRHVAIEDTQNRAGLRWTVDTMQDLKMIRMIAASLGPQSTEASYTELLALVDSHPEWQAINADVEQKQN